MIEWRGLIPHSKIPALLKECDIGLCPLPGLEAFKVSVPIKVLEYLAAGIVVIASDILAHRKLIQHSKNGLLFNPGDSYRLSSFILQVYHDCDLRSKLRFAAIESVKEYDWKVLLESFNTRLEALLR